MGFKDFFRKFKKDEHNQSNSGDAAKERLHMVLMQDRANVSADFIDLMKQDIIDNIKKYVDVDEKEIDVRLTNQIKNDGSNGAPALYANIPIASMKNESKKVDSNTKNANTKSKKDLPKNSILGTDILKSITKESLNIKEKDLIEKTEKKERSAENIEKMAAKISKSAKDTAAKKISETKSKEELPKNSILGSTKKSAASKLTTERKTVEKTITKRKSAASTAKKTTTKTATAKATKTASSTTKAAGSTTRTSKQKVQKKEVS